MAPKTCRIIRKSIFTLLQNYEYFTSTPTLLAFPYAASYLLTQSLVTSSRLFLSINGRLESLFLAAGFPFSSRIFASLIHKLSQTATTFIFVSPLAFTFLLLARASVISQLRKTSPSSSLFIPLFITQLCNTLVTLAANATCFSLFALCFSILDSLNLSSSSRGPTTMILSAASVVIYYIALANAYIVCNLASVSSGMESRGGLVSIVKAWVVIRQGRGRTATALFLAVAMNLGFAGIEGLFRYRIVGGYRKSSGLVVIGEGVLIGFLYALLLVLDTIVGCVFWRSCCKKDEHLFDLEEENYFHQIQIAENKLRLV